MPSTTSGRVRNEGAAPGEQMPIVVPKGSMRHASFAPLAIHCSILRSSSSGESLGDNQLKPAQRLWMQFRDAKIGPIVASVLMNWGMACPLLRILSSQLLPGVLPIFANRCTIGGFGELNANAQHQFDTADG